MTNNYYDQGNQPPPRQYMPGENPTPQPWPDQNYAGGYQRSPAYLEQPQRNRPWIWVLVTLLVVALIGAIAALIFWAVSGREQQSQEPEVVYVTEVHTVETTPAPAPEQAPAPSAAPQQAPAPEPPRRQFSTARPGTSVTSEQFTTSVFNAFVANYNATGQINGTISAYSPVTERTYTMSCRDQGSYVSCTGGDNAQVIIS